MYQLKVDDGVRTGLSDTSRDARALLLNDIAEYFRRVLLRLIVADDAYLDALFIAEVLVVVHLASNEGVGTQRHSVGQQEIACTTTKGYLADRAFKQLVTLGTLHAELLFHQFNKGSCRHRRGKLPYYTAACLNAVDCFLCEELTILQA